ncbi:hypothetical protein B9Z55_006487 [Caenorhabditis nigoni]|uniref:Mannosyltransferase n=1 Tax=Caenorhabditis nigoni TaxID=1611254 RepID=A0A2G5V5H7_9PELO|nr:hypothetical protein B9Z55_006487 [Caenorhabditis nigoni]
MQESSLFAYGILVNKEVSHRFMSIANLNRPADAFEQLETEDGVRQGVCHIRIQQRTGRKTITTVQGIGTEYDLKRIVQYLKKGITWPYIAFGVVTVVIRPTVALIWIVFGLHHLYYNPHPFRLLLRTVLPVALPILTITVMIDSWAYGKPTIPLWNFLQFNVVQGGSSLFGVHPWHWYITSGAPAVLTVQLLPIFIGIVGPSIFRPTLLPLIATVFYITVHSLLPHKEQRFLLPIIPLLCIYAGGAFQGLKKWRGSAIIAMVTINIGIVIFTSRYHQVGPFAAPRRIMEEWRDHHGTLSVAALMPCYSLPGHAYWHTHLKTLRLLDCSPDLMHIRGPNELDEADQFHSNSTKWLIEKFALEHQNYQRVLMYEKVYEPVRRWFETNGWYQCIEKIWHSIALTSSREDNYMIKHSCNGTIVEHPEYGEVIQLTGDQREKVKDFLIKVGIVNESNCRVHGF